MAHEVEHVGSTAVPGLPAKPVIDILVGVPVGEHVERAQAALERIGYLRDPDAERDDSRRRVFRKGSADLTEMRTHHVHLTITGGDYWRRLLAFRDQLRRDPEAAAEYVAAKYEALRACRGDSRAYTAGKHEIVKKIERLAGVDVP